MRPNTYDGLFAIDWIVVGAYLLLTVGMGVYFSLRQRDTEEYFLAGGNMPWFAVGLSILATLLSTVSYLSVPGEMIKHGLGVLAGVLSYPVAYVVIGFLIIPYFMRQRMSTAHVSTWSRNSASAPACLPPACSWSPALPG